MWNMLWPILIVIAANAIYNISAKSTPANINLFASLSVTYLIAMICSIFYWNYQKRIGRPMLSELQSLAWSLGFYVFIVLDGK